MDVSNQVDVRGDTERREHHRARDCRQLNAIAKQLAIFGQPRADMLEHPGAKRLVARGRSTRDVAGELGISAKTADRHIQSIYQKVGVRSRAAVTLFAMQHGFIAPKDGENS